MILQTRCSARCLANEVLLFHPDRYRNREQQTATHNKIKLASFISKGGDLAFTVK
jgi:hypothetical protein